MSIPICRSVCENLLTQCTSVFQDIGLSSLLPSSCSVYPLQGTAPCESLEKSQIPGTKEKNKEKKRRKKEKRKS